MVLCEMKQTGTLQNDSIFAYLGAAAFRLDSRLCRVDRQMPPKTQIKLKWINQ